VHIKHPVLFLELFCDLLSVSIWCHAHQYWSYPHVLQAVCRSPHTVLSLSQDSNSILNKQSQISGCNNNIWKKTDQILNHSKDPLIWSTRNKLTDMRKNTVITVNRNHTKVLKQNNTSTNLIAQNWSRVRNSGDIMERIDNTHYQEHPHQLTTY